MTLTDFQRRLRTGAGERELDSRPSGHVATCSAACGRGCSRASTRNQHTTDLIVNTAGALIGWAIFVAVRRMSGEHTSVVMTYTCVTVSALALVAAVANRGSP